MSADWWDDLPYDYADDESWAYQERVAQYEAWLEKQWEASRTN